MCLILAHNPATFFWHIIPISTFHGASAVQHRKWLFNIWADGHIIQALRDSFLARASSSGARTFFVWSARLTKIIYIFFGMLQRYTTFCSSNVFEIIVAPNPHEFGKSKQGNYDFVSLTPKIICNIEPGGNEGLFNYFSSPHQSSIFQRFFAYHHSSLSCKQETRLNSWKIE